MVKECITSELMEKMNNENNRIKRMKGGKKIIKLAGEIKSIL